MVRYASITDRGELCFIKSSDLHPNDSCHRDGDLPQEISTSGSIFYMKYNTLHRVCGPAVIRKNGSVGYYRYGNSFRVEQL